MPQKGSSQYHPKGRSPTPSTGTPLEMIQRRDQNKKNQNQNHPHAIKEKVDHTVKTPVVQLFLKTFELAVNTKEYGLDRLKKYCETIQLVAMVFCASKTLRAGYKAQISNPLVFQDCYKMNEGRKEKENYLEGKTVCLWAKLKRLRSELVAKFKKNDGFITRSSANPNILCGFPSSRFSKRT
ncbi:uncharacterized protein MELLADRAFT_110490 [Melampsora larici-populina 98AG31]|uniref:Uncharacterized protein n=1 Tax=Melampsora larici-populina (strain 98AG31 / pathotype 3-4-7) TaxID=747676 RepID=F4RZZ5_MELLP|nr:uncharacterized protein MELLADRAFT_110490 [Melampsora larici-populina 98AG31]EGG02102.1 hypothetical protein MELLADRAFT_110490 [Melampsora larici-populina 98AG31]